MSKYTKIVYITIFAILLLQPHFIDGHMFSISRAYAQSAVTAFLIGGIFLVYYLNQQDIRKTEQKKRLIEDKLEISTEKLNEAFKYIGIVNRKLPLLSTVTTELLSKSSTQTKVKKEIFNDLLATAVTSIAKAQWGMFRFINIETSRTVSEFVYTHGRYALLKSQISNTELLENCKHKTINHLQDTDTLTTSDSQNTIRCYLIVAQSERDLAKEFSVLQAIVDQAQLFFQYLNPVRKVHTHTSNTV